MPNKKLKTPVIKQRTNNKSFLFLLAVICPPLILMLLRESAYSNLPNTPTKNYSPLAHLSKDHPSSIAHSDKKSACDQYFTNQTFFVNSKSVKTTLIGELHGIHEELVADCLEMLAKKGDHLLIEAPSDGKEVACDAVNSHYSRFNGKLKCFGFDVPIDESRRLWSDNVFRANFIANKAKLFFNNARSGKEVIDAIKNFSEYMAQQKAPAELLNTDKDFMKRNAKYLRSLAQSMSGLDLHEMHPFLVNENNRLVEKANYYEKLSRSGPTNNALVTQIKNHQKQLSSSQHSLFAVAGSNHIDLSKNEKLHEVISSEEPVTILTPKN